MIPKLTFSKSSTVFEPVYWTVCVYFLKDLNFIDGFCVLLLGLILENHNIVRVSKAHHCMQYSSTYYEKNSAFSVGLAAESLLRNIPNSYSHVR